MTDACPGWVSPVTWSSRDTPETIKEISVHNGKYEHFCPSSEV